MQQVNIIYNRNEAEIEECKGVRKEEGVAQFEFGIKIGSTMESFFLQFGGATVICSCLEAQLVWGQAGPSRALTQR